MLAFYGYFHAVYSGDIRSSEDFPSGTQYLVLRGCTIDVALGHLSHDEDDCCQTFDLGILSSVFKGDPIFSTTVQGPYSTNPT